VEALVVVVALLLLTVVVVGVGDRLGLPWPALLTIIAALGVFVPNVPEFELDNELILPLFLPPLLWALARRTSWVMFKERWRTILGFSVLLVVVTVVAVAWTAWVLVPGATLAAAIAIGAAVAPPDPVAVDAVAEHAPIPRRLTSLLHTEGLFNDAVALVAFQLALAITLQGETLEPLAILQTFSWTVVAALAVGLGAGWLAARVMRWLTSPVARSALTLVVPFAVYMLAEEVHGSGVIAVVVAAVYLSGRNDEIEAQDRLTSAAFWHVIELLVTGLAFGLIGLEFRHIVDDAGKDLGPMVLHGLVVAAVAIAVRVVWVFGGQWVLGKKHGQAPRSWQESLLISWCGMRGLVTLALVLALPAAEFPVRAEALVIAVVVLGVTMVLPGLALPWLVGRLHLGAGESVEEAQERALVARAQRAAFAVAREAIAQGAPPEVLESLAQRFGDVTGVADDDGPVVAEYAERAEAMRERLRQYSGLRDAALAAATAEVLRARNEPGVDPHAVDVVLADLDRMAVGHGSRSRKVALPPAPAP